MRELTARIKKRARQLGFQKVGVCAAAGPPTLAYLADWLDRGCHGTMAWMERTREKRLDISSVLPGARSVVVTGMNYFTSAASESADLPARISRYAHGSDYHDLLNGRLRHLADFVIQERADVGARVYADTGPVSEKVWAQQAGLGWQGKHTNLITQDHSSWVFLGVLLLDIELEYDTPAADHCGSCRRCIDACPTQAITEPYVVDGRLCISYLNIEHRGVIPMELRPGIGSWVFGCDVCQEVCPWNRFVKETEEAEFLPAGWMPREDAAALLECGADEFRRRFRDSPVKRAKWAGLLRNIAIALGNSGEARFGPALVKALEHPEALVRGHAAWALGRLGWPAGRDALQARATIEADPWVRAEIELAMEDFERHR